MNQHIVLLILVFVLNLCSGYCHGNTVSSPAFNSLVILGNDTNNATMMQLENSVISSAPYTVTVQLLPSKGIDNHASEIFLSELGNPPSEKESEKISLALNLLQNSKVGPEICNSVGITNLPSCTWASLRKVGVQITSRDLNHHIPVIDAIVSYVIGSTDYTSAVPKPSWVKGQKILCLDTNLIADYPPAYISTYILHELSHIADNQTLGEGDYAPIAAYATEYKAITTQMMISDELLRTGKLKVNPADGIQFILSVYRWRNGGPKPNMSYSVVLNEKRYSAAELIGTYAPPGDTGLKIIWKLIKFYYPKYSEGTIDENGLKYLRGIRGFIKELEPKYQLWFPSKPPVVGPPNNPNNGNNGGGNNNGGGGSGGGGHHDDDNNGGSSGGGTINPGNPCPNPHFDPVTGQALCF